MKIDQRQFERAAALDISDQSTTDAFLQSEMNLNLPRSDINAEAQLHKLFLARLDVHSRIADLNRNRTKLKAQKIDVQSKIAHLFEFDMKIMKREEELSRLNTQG